MPFTSNTQYDANKHSLEWLANGDTRLVVSVSANGQERRRFAFTFTSGGRILDNFGVDIGAVPANWATTLSAFAARVDTAVAAAVSQGRLDP